MLKYLSVLLLCANLSASAFESLEHNLLCATLQIADEVNQKLGFEAYGVEAQYLEIAELLEESYPSEETGEFCLKTFNEDHDITIRILCDPYNDLIESHARENTSGDEDYARTLSEELNPDTVADAAIAQTLVESGTNYLENDEALARLLAKGPQIVFPGDLRGLFQTYRQAVATRTSQDMDVHACNRAVAAEMRAIYEADGIEYPAVKSMDEIWAELIATDAYQAHSNQAGITANYNQLKEHIAANPIEGAETGLNVLHLLNRYWYLMNLSPDAARYNDFFFVLIENAATGGGCYPGHAGRLLQRYVVLLESYYLNGII